MSGKCSNSLGRTVFGGGFGCNSCETSAAPEATCAAPAIEEGTVGPIPTPAPVQTAPKLPRVPTVVPPAPPVKPLAEPTPVPEEEAPAPVAEEPAPMELQAPATEAKEEAAPPAKEAAPELSMKSSRRIARVTSLPTLNAPR